MAKRNHGGLMTLDLSDFGRRAEYQLTSELDKSALLPHYKPPGWEKLSAKERNAAEFMVCPDCGQASEPSLVGRTCPSCGGMKLQRCVLPLDQLAVNAMTRLSMEYVSGRKTIRILEYVFNCTLRNYHTKRPQKGRSPYHAILSYTTIAKHAKCTRRQAIYVVQRLEQAGLLIKKVRGAGFNHLCNLYTLGPKVWGAVHSHPLLLTPLGSFRRWKLSAAQVDRIKRVVQSLELRGTTSELLEAGKRLLLENSNGGWDRAHAPPPRLIAAF